jgi:hypothetical protein
MFKDLRKKMADHNDRPILGGTIKIHLLFHRAQLPLLAQCNITCDGKNQNPFFINGKRNPNCVIKTFNFRHQLLPYIGLIITNKWPKSKKLPIYFL